jgi:hypothetical protein
MILFTGCGSEGDSSSSLNTSPQEVKVTVSACTDNDNAEAAAALEEAAAGSTSILQALASNNFEGAKSASASTKADFATLLSKYPSNCGAQLGYAVAIVADLVNNQQINSLYNTVNGDNPATLLNIDPESYTKVLMKTNALAKSSDQTLVTEQIQSIIATGILPAIDSAIIYFRNVVNTEGFTFTFTADNRTWELDKGEFAPALGVLQFAKAYLTAIASINIDASMDNSYNWALTLASMSESDFSNLSSDQKAALDHVTSLLSSKSPFTTVRDGWESYWTNIPNLLDSAISDVQAGLTYGIEESEDPNNTQANDVYIVGTEEDADVSPADLQLAIDSMETIKSYLHKPVTIAITDSISIKVDLSKYFTITDGFQDFLPYYKLTDYSTWLTPPAETMVWETELNWDLDGSAAANEIAAVAASVYGAKVDYVWGYNSLYVDLLTDDYDYITVQVNLDGCQYTLDDDATIHTLSTTSCVDTAGYAEYQNFNVTIPDVLIFTDKQGNETIHAYKLALPKNEAGDSWTISDMKDLIIFPDPTFHGIFPDMTQDSIWNLIENLYSFGKSMDNEDEDAEWTDDEMDFDEYSRSL